MKKLTLTFAIVLGMTLGALAQSNSSLFRYDNQIGDHSILMKNNFLQIYGVPVFCLPILYKPSDLSSFGGKIEFGSRSDWGWVIHL